MKNLTRRSMLALLGAGVAGGVAAVVGRAFVTDPAPVKAASHGSASTDGSDPVDVTTPIGQVGAAYLALTPDEASRDRLLELVPELEGVPRREIEGRLGVLEARARDDFAAGDIVVIDGWVLSRTEARGAALVVAS